jgi:hypothetical protein
MLNIQPFALPDIGSQSQLELVFINRTLDADSNNLVDLVGQCFKATFLSSNWPQQLPRP